MPTPFFADLVRELCQEGGTGPLTLTGAVPGHRRFVDAVPADASFHYAVAGVAQPGQWEVGVGRVSASGQLLRDTVMSSSNDGAPVDFASGLKTVALTVGAGWFAASDAAGAALGEALAVKQPLSTSHAAAETGAAGDYLTVRRGSGWVNIPLSSVAFRDAGGSVRPGGPIAATDGAASLPAVGFASDPDTGLFHPAADVVGLSTGGSERVRIDAAGNVGIGTVPTTRFVVQTSAGRFSVANAGGSSVKLISSATMQYDVAAGNLHEFLINGVGRLAIEATGHVRPGADNVQSLGMSGNRWSVVYAGTGTINTSDARDKRWRGALTAAETRAARRIAGEMGFYQWKDAVAAKGAGAARRHFGVRAQAVWAIMADEGLIDPIDADGRPGATPYAFLCWDEWVDAASGERVDRFGVRPDQLALFLIAAQERRLAALEGAA